MGLVINFLAAWLWWVGFWTAGAWALIIAGICDVLDGQIARRSKSGSKFGALLDSTGDRFSEIAVFFALVVVYMERGWIGSAAGVFLAAAGSVMVSYVRARAEGLGFDCSVGMMQRAERILILCAAAMFGEMGGAPAKNVAVAVWIIAFFAFFTAFQRVKYIHDLIQNGSSPSLPQSQPSSAQPSSIEG